VVSGVCCLRSLVYPAVAILRCEGIEVEMWEIYVDCGSFVPCHGFSVTKNGKKCVAARQIRGRISGAEPPTENSRKIQESPDITVYHTRILNELVIGLFILIHWSIYSIYSILHPPKDPPRRTHYNDDATETSVMNSTHPE
jgi:hypothetical protein